MSPDSVCDGLTVVREFTVGAVSGTLTRVSVKWTDTGAAVLWYGAG